METNKESTLHDHIDSGSPQFPYSDALAAAIKGYLRNRQSLVERICELSKSPQWSGFSAAHNCIKDAIAETDKHVAALIQHSAHGYATTTSSEH